MGLRLQAEVGLDGSGFEATLRRLDKASERVGGSLKHLAISAFGIYGVEQAFQKTVEAAEQLVNTASRLDMTVEQMQILKQAAKDTGVEFEKIPALLEKINMARAKALGGDEKAMAAFAKLGVGNEALRNQTAAGMMFGPMRDAAMTHNVQDLNAAFGALGKGMNVAIPLLRGGIDDAEKSLRQMGALMDTETAVKLKHLGDQMSLVSTMLTSMFAPAIIKVVDSLMDAASRYLGFIDGKTENAPTGAIGRFGKGVLGLGTGLVGLWNTVGSAIGIPGAEENAKQQVDFTNKMFAQAGWGGGVLDSMAESINKAASQGGSLQGAFDAMRKKFQAEIAAEVARLNNPLPPEIGGPLAGSEKKLHNPRMHEDALMRVGNFLGSSDNMLSRIGERTNQLLHSIDGHLARMSHRTLHNEGTGFPP